MKVDYTNFDIYSKKICFFFNDKEKVSSLFGFLLTMLYLFVSVILFFYQLILAIQRKNLKVYDTTIYSKDMPIIDVDINQLYFAFGLEYPNTANRYVDESIYTVELTFLDKRKIEDEFVTVNERKLDFEKCDVNNFGKDYQNLFVKDELNNSYCLKDFNYTLTLAGSYKFDRITYIRIFVFPCVNSTKNNYSCKPQEVIDSYFNSGYFSIVLKDFGLNPSNYSSPRIPTLQDLYTTIDKRISKNYILNFGLTEIHTDKGLLNENINKEKYLQFRKVLESFSFREEKDYLAGKSLILVQLRLEDTIFVQKRTYTKVSEILSVIGGYMQFMNTVFLLVSSFVNKIHSEIKIINSIFNFNLKENKIILKLKTILDSNKMNTNLPINKNVIFTFKSPFNKTNQFECENKSKNYLILKDLEPNTSFPNITTHNKRFTEMQNMSNNRNIISYESSKNESIKSRNDKLKIELNSNYFSRDNLQRIIQEMNNKDNNSYANANKDNINLSIFDYLFSRKNAKKKKQIKLYNKGNYFYRKKMDIVHVFTLLSIIEDFIKT
jgi:hypothetical protein